MPEGITPAPKGNTAVFEHHVRRYRVALAGNPNSGKTTLFNALTGSRYKVANYPGVTVEKREGTLIHSNSENANLPQIDLLDLPGTYNLFGTAPDELVATAELLGNPQTLKSVRSDSSPQLDAAIVAVDASNIERNLYLVSQLIDLQIPLIVALTMNDIAEKHGIRVFNELLARELDVPVITTTTGKNLDQLRHTLIRVLEERRRSKQILSWLHFAPTIRDCLASSTNNAAAASNIGALYALAGVSEAIVGGTLHRESTERLRSAVTEADLDPLSFEATYRYKWIRDLVGRTTSETPTRRSALAQKIDRVLTHPVSGTLVLAAILMFVFQSIFLWAELPMDFISAQIETLGRFVGPLLPEGILRSLVVDGMIAGVGNVVVFIPQIAILFLFLGLLEDSGYLSRAAYLLDNFMRRFGLQGRAFIPLLSSFACAIPGIMSTRTIPSRADRLATILIAPLMSCSARLPVYAVLIAACIPPLRIWGWLSLQGLVLFAMYALGVISAALVAWLLKRTVLRREPAFLVMEMPVFRRPSLTVVLRAVWDRILAFIRNAGTMILACSIVLWFLASYPKAPENYPGNKVQYSYAGRLGTFIEPVIRPLGYNWEIGVALIGSFAAREVFVSSLAMVYNLADEEDSSLALENTLREKRERGEFTLPTALSLLVFYVYACMCMSTLAVAKRETGSWGWTIFMFVYMTGLAYVTAFVTYRAAIAYLI